MNQDHEPVLLDMVLLLQSTVLFAVLVVAMCLFGVIASSATACSVAAMFMYVLLLDTVLLVGATKRNKVCTGILTVLLAVLHIVRFTKSPIVTAIVGGVVIALPALIATATMIIVSPFMRFIILTCMLAPHIYLRARHNCLYKGDK